MSSIFTFKDFEKQKTLAIGLASGLLAGLVGGAAAVLALTVVHIPGVSNQLENLSTATTTKREKIVLEESSAIIDAVKKISPSVVSVTTSRNIQDFLGRSIEQETGGGTGFVLTSDGLIVTNRHVVSDANAKYSVLTSDGKTYEAKVLSRDTLNDLAVLKIEAKGLKPVELGDSDALNSGQWVIAIGNALGEFQNSVTVGVVSAKARKIDTPEGSLDGLIQTDAAINPGNSGGPLINLSGQVVGINTAIAGGAEGIGFAINIDSVKTALDSVQKTGTIVRPFLGVRYLPLNKEIARSANLPSEKGALVYRGANPTDIPVVAGSPAEKAGIKENDIILKINNQELNENTSLVSLLQKYKPGDTIDLTILRGGQEMKIPVKLEEQT